MSTRLEENSMDEYFTLDKNWEDFAGLVAKALEHLPADGAFLILSRKKFGPDDPDYFVQFSTAGDHGLRAEAVSNQLLPPQYELTLGSEQTLWELGWRPPKRGAKPTGERVNYHLEWPPPFAYRDAARLVAATLHVVYGTASPQDLQYKCFLEDGRTLVQPVLGIDPRPIGSELPTVKPAGPDIDSIREFVDISLREILHTDDLKRDDDGDIPIRFGSALVFVRLVEADGALPSLHVFAPVVWDLKESPEILEAVNEMNLSIRFGRATWEETQVMVAADLPTPMLTKENIAFVCDQIGAVADYFDDRLQQEFGGSIMFGERLPRKEAHIGGYL